MRAVLRPDIDQVRLLRTATVHDFRATRVEAAAAGRVLRVANVARQHDPALPVLRIGLRHGGDQGFGVGMAWLTVEPFRLGGLD